MTHPTQEDDVKALRDALALGPTPGPWTVEIGGGIPVAIATDAFILAQTAGGNDDANAIYIAEANPARIARLLARLEQAEQDAGRLDWLRDNLFVNRWNGVIGKGCAVQWSVAPDYRFKSRELTDQSGIAAGDFRRAIDSAIDAHIAAIASEKAS